MAIANTVNADNGVGEANIASTHADDVVDALSQAGESDGDVLDATIEYLTDSPTIDDSRDVDYMP